MSLNDCDWKMGRDAVTWDDAKINLYCFEPLNFRVIGFHVITQALLIDTTYVQHILLCSRDASVNKTEIATDHIVLDISEGS